MSEVTIETDFESTEPAQSQEVPSEIPEKPEIEKASAAYKQRMLDLAFNVLHRQETQSFTPKQYKKRKRLNKIAKKSRKSHR